MRFCDLEMETKRVLETFISKKSADYILKNYPSPRYLLNLTEKEINAVPYVNRAKARLLKSVFDLCKLTLLPEPVKGFINSSEDVFEHLKIIGTFEEECLFGIYLNTRCQIIDTIMINKGLVSCSFFGVREFFAPAVRLKASAVIAVHNHPAGSLEISEEDIKSTEMLKAAGQVVGVNFLDHVIIAGNDFVSIMKNSSTVGSGKNEN